MAKELWGGRWVVRTPCSPSPQTTPHKPRTSEEKSPHPRFVFAGMQTADSQLRPCQPLPASSTQWLCQPAGTGTERADHSFCCCTALYSPHSHARKRLSCPTESRSSSTARSSAIGAAKSLGSDSRRKMRSCTGNGGERAHAVNTFGACTGQPVGH